MKGWWYQNNLSYSEGENYCSEMIIFLKPSLCPVDRFPNSSTPLIAKIRLPILSLPYESLHSILSDK